MARPRLSFEAPAPLAALAPLCNPDTDGGYPVVVIYFACFSLHHAESHLVAFPVDLGVTCHPSTEPPPLASTLSFAQRHPCDSHHLDCVSSTSKHQLISNVHNASPLPLRPIIARHVSSAKSPHQLHQSADSRLRCSFPPTHTAAPQSQPSSTILPGWPGTLR